MQIQRIGQNYQNPQNPNFGMNLKIRTLAEGMGLDGFRRLKVEPLQDLLEKNPEAKKNFDNIAKMLEGKEPKGVPVIAVAADRTNPGLNPFMEVCVDTTAGDMPAPRVINLLTANAEEQKAFVESVVQYYNNMIKGSFTGMIDGVKQIMP